MPLHLAADAQAPWTAGIDHPSLDRVGLWVVNAQGQIAELYLRVTTTGAMVLPLTLWQPVAFHVEESNEMQQQGLHAGIASCLFIYAILYWVSTRERMHLFYAAAVAATLLTLADSVQFILHVLRGPSRRQSRALPRDGLAAVRRMHLRHGRSGWRRGSVRPCAPETWWPGWGRRIRVLAVGAKLQSVFLAPFELEGVSTSIGATIGCALAPVQGADADAAMYRGKESGGFSAPQAPPARPAAAVTTRCTKCSLATAGRESTKG